MSLILPTPSGWSSFWSMTGDKIPYAMIPQSQNGGRAAGDKLIAQRFKRNQNRDVVAAFLALIGAAAGGTATSTHKQVGSPHGPSMPTPQVTGLTSLGGNRTIETVTDINRATTSADITYLNKYFNNKLLEAGITYPTVSGSGGGGKITGNVIGF